MQKIWNSLPISVSIIDILQRKGTSTDLDILKELKKPYGDTSYRELNDTLMRLELRGLIRISRLAKDKRNVELLKKAR